MYGTNRITALPPGESADVGINISMFNEGAHPFMSRINNLTVMYADLAGRQFTTEFSWSFRGFDQEGPLTAHLAVTPGVTPDASAEGLGLSPDNYANPLGLIGGSRFWPSPYAIRIAWHTVTQVPEFGPVPFPAPISFHRRAHSAWRELFPRRRVQRFQRIAWSARVYQATLDKPFRSRRWRLVAVPYRVARGLKWAWLSYFRMR
jgi:hypothetical protein